jgi:hypothetical protein
MTVSTSLYELILNLLRDPKAMEDFQDDPEAYLASCGDFSADDVKDAIELIRDNDDDNSNGRDSGPTVHVAPPSDPPEPRDGESEHEAAVRYLNTYVTNNYIDDRDTTVDNSINQDIDNRGGIFDQDIDIDSNVASGDGAVAADDITNSDVVTGDDNVVGDDNVTGDDNVVGDDNEVVSGDDNTTSFGDGDATSTEVDGNVTVGAGGSFSSGSGDTEIDNSDNSTNIEDSGNVDSSVNDSGNVQVEDSFQDNSETDIDASTQDNDDISSTVENRVAESEDVDITN